MSDEIAEILHDQLSQLQNKRTTWESHWQEIADFVVPRKADITKKRTQGDKRNAQIFDGTAIHAAELLAASLHGMLTNMSTKWFTLEYRDPMLNGDDTAREWLLSVEDVMYRTFQRSNFSEQVHEMYLDLITFGTSVMFIEQDTITDVNFSTRHIGECYISEDKRGRVDTVYRVFNMPGHALRDRFGVDKLSKKLQDRIDEYPHDAVELVHAVYPRDNYDVTMATKENKPFASVYYEPTETVVLSEGGFDELPYVVPRYQKSSTEIYGRSPSMTALPDIKMLNKMSETTIRAAQKQVDPPLLVPDDSFILPIKTVPSGLNFYRSGTRDRIEPLNIGANNPLGLNMEEQRRGAIRSAYYVDQLIMGQGPQMTATEVVQRTEEKMRLLGPSMFRVQVELLQPLITRVYAILARDQKFMPAPEMIRTADVEIEYVSPLAKAQRQVDVTSLTQMLELMGPIGQINPQVFDYVDFDGVAKHLIKTLSIPATIIKGDDEVARTRQERAAQQQEMMQQQQLAQQAEALGAAAPMVAAVNK